MFGYIVPDKAELKFREFDEYRSYYCGLCRELKENYGIKGQITLNYDLTFLALLLTGLYEPETVCSSGKCIAHPFSKQVFRRNEYTKYAADMNILLTRYQCLDDWEDERKLSRRLFAASLSRSAAEVEEKYPQQAQTVSEKLTELSALEKEGCTDIDRVAGTFGEIMARIFVYREDEWEKYLRSAGFYLGKYIYLLDAYVDYEEDIKKGRYNPFAGSGADPEKCREILTMMMAGCSSAFEMLPVIGQAPILRNIIYAGVWTGFEAGHAVKPESEILR